MEDLITALKNYGIKLHVEDVTGRFYLSRGSNWRNDILSGTDPEL